MDAEPATDPNLTASLDCLREHRDEMARWLALEVLQHDPIALADDELLRRLGQCQERLEERLRARTGAAGVRAPDEAADEPGQAAGSE